jgi:hypothetical protein
MRHRSPMRSVAVCGGGALVYASGALVLPLLHLVDHGNDHRHGAGGVALHGQGDGGVEEHGHGHVHGHEHDHGHGHDHGHDRDHDPEHADRHHHGDRREGPSEPEMPDPGHGRGALAHFSVAVTAAHDLPTLVFCGSVQPTPVLAPDVPRVRPYALALQRPRGPPA